MSLLLDIRFLYLLFMKIERSKNMNKIKSDILSILLMNGYTSQRILAETLGYSLGSVNRIINELLAEGYLNQSFELTAKAQELFENNKPKRAIILAAGFGMRMVPINTEIPKAFIEVNGEVLIERQIRHLHEVGIREIYIVVGFFKEKFEYLIDQFGVQLIVNSEYAVKNNLHSLNLALKYISNAYIVPCDIWCAENPFSYHELYSWYMITNLDDDDSNVRVNRKGDLMIVSKSSTGNTMIGITYLLEEDAVVFRKNLQQLCEDKQNDNAFYEKALLGQDKMLVKAKLVPSNKVVEINTYEQLREFDENSNQLKTDAISIIATTLGVDEKDIKNIEVLKKGMTNRSFMFLARGIKYIMRIPGEGTNKLINRNEEFEVYQAISGTDLCDDPIYLNPINGYKITKFIDNVRVCDPSNINDVKLAMQKLKTFHSMKLQVDHYFDIYGKIDFYETLFPEQESIYKDYKETKNNIQSLKHYIDENIEEIVLTHIDAVPDNFLFGIDENGKETFQLTDWEYSGMQDPHVDIAMFCIYSLYDKDEIDALIDLYFNGQCSQKIVAKIYCYIAVCGLLWSNWCEYKRNLGVEFGEYNLRQYRYAKDYYKYARILISKQEEFENV